MELCWCLGWCQHPNSLHHLYGLQGRTAKMPNANLHLAVRHLHVSARIKKVALFQDAVDKTAFLNYERLLADSDSFILCDRHECLPMRLLVFERLEEK
jgi:hypothetical protein